MQPCQILALQKFINKWLPANHLQLEEDGKWGRNTSDAFDVVFANYSVEKALFDDGGNIQFKFDGLTKDQWFHQNKSALLALIGEVNKEGGNSLLPEEVFAVLYSEIAVSGGRVNTTAVHSEGEYGILPLPSNLRFWTDSNAPDTKESRTPPVRNIYWFIRYLHGLKNKPTGKSLKLSSGPYKLYSGLWQYRGIGQEPVKSANLLAAVVHGYFYSKNFSKPSAATYEKILNRIAAGEPPHKVVEGTTYRHEGKTFMLGRSNNMETGLSFV